MKTHQDPISLLIEIKNKALLDSASVVDLATNRRQRLHRAFNANFNADSFLQSIEQRTLPMINKTSDEFPIVGGIPVTDLLVYGHKRIEEMSKITSAGVIEKAKALLLQLVEIDDVGFMPISIASADLGNGEIHIPTFGEICFDSLSKSIVKSAHDVRSEGLSVLPTFESYVSKLSNVDKKLGQGSVPLAIIGLQLAFGHQKSLTVFDDATLASACLHLIETQTPYLNDGVIENLLYSAHELKIKLRDLQIGQTIPLMDFLVAADKSELHDKYESLCVLNEAMEVIHENHDRIDHSYNANDYFDM